MKNIYILSLIVFALVLTNCADTQSNAQALSNAETQSNTKALSKSFLEMTEKEKAAFVTAKTGEITQKISGKKYPFDAGFQAQVLKFLEAYAGRVGNNIKDRPFGQDLNFVLRRGAESAPTINAAFDKQGVSRLSGLYIAMIETEFNNELVSPTGSSGVFQLTAAQAKKFGMEKKDLADLSKSAEIAARLLIEDQKRFESDNMKEFLAILNHNREPGKIAADLSRKPIADGKDCSICAMTKNASALDEQFRLEAVKYIPKFLAAAIIGENPADFGLTAKPLSTLGAETSQTASTGNSDLNVSPDYWKSQLNKALEPRKAPAGVDLKGVTIPEELIGNNGKQKTTLQAMKAQAFDLPMDFFDLAERNLNKELVEVPAAAGNYVLDIDRNVTDKVFTEFNFKDGAAVPAANSDREKRMKELAGNLKLNLNVANDRKQIRLHLLRMIYPKGKTVLEEIAAQYQAKFNRPLLVTSLARSIDYQIDLSKVDAGAFLVREDGAIPPHCSGMAFDIAVKNLTAEEQNFIAGILAEMDRSGKVDAIRESGPTGVFHVFVL